MFHINGYLSVVCSANGAYRPWEHKSDSVDHHHWMSEHLSCKIRSLIQAFIWLSFAKKLFYQCSSNCLVHGDFRNRLLGLSQAFVTVKLINISIISDSCTYSCDMTVTVGLLLGKQGRSHSDLTFHSICSYLQPLVGTGPCLHTGE